MGKLLVVAGGQFGSEAKGAVTARLCRQEVMRDVDVLNVRVGGPNAGHTVYDDNGREWKLRQCPVGIVIPFVRTAIAAGSEVDPKVLHEEARALAAAGYGTDVMIDGEATLLERKHIGLEQRIDLTAKLGSTAKGIGAARADRLMRGAQRWKDVEPMDSWDVAAEARRTLNNGGTVIIEGTQGYGLGLHAGRYPYCTSGDARAIDFLAQAGISPWHRSVTDLEIWVVFRTRPIRVAGNSGTLKGETSWQDLGLPDERTTVTNKVRRVGEWDTELAYEAIHANGGPGGPVKVALTMLDQMVPDCTGWTTLPKDKLGQGGGLDALLTLVERVENDLGTPVSLVGTSPTTMIDWEHELSGARR